MATAQDTLDAAQHVLEVEIEALRAAQQSGESGEGESRRLERAIRSLATLQVRLAEAAKSLSSELSALSDRELVRELVKDRVLRKIITEELKGG